MNLSQNWRIFQMLSHQNWTYSFKNQNYNLIYLEGEFASHAVLKTFTIVIKKKKKHYHQSNNSSIQFSHISMKLKNKNKI